MATAVSEIERCGDKKELLSKLSSLDSRVVCLEREARARWSEGGLEEQLKTHRCAHKAELRGRIVEVRGSVARLQRMLSEKRPAKPSFVEALKKAMEDIESSIAAFKNHQRALYEELVAMETSLSVEVTAIERRLESWTTPTNNTAAVTMITNVSSVPPAVLAFERFLGQTGGHEGGWDTIDHTTFVRIRTQFKGAPSYIDAATSALPTKALAEVMEHDAWFTEFTSLRDSKREAIQEWRKHKQSARKVGRSPEELLVKTSNVSAELVAKERQEKQAKLSEWKVQQELKRVEAEEERVRMEALQSKARERQQRRKTVLKNQVADYTREKELTQQAQLDMMEEQRQQEVERKRLATKQVVAFRERDMRALGVRQEMARRREAEMEAKTRALERTKCVVSVQRDPCRVYRATAGWEARLRAVRETPSIHGPLPRRAIPSWRQGH